MATTTSRRATDSSHDSIRDQVFGSPGYFASLSLAPDELACIREHIEEQWLNRISECHPDGRESFREAGIARYHELGGAIDHRALWPKRHRMLPPHAVEDVKSFAFMGPLRDALGEFRISQVADVDDRSRSYTTIRGREEVYWRLVRPGEDGDVGSLHADSWFHRVLDGGRPMFRDDQETVKLWVSVHGEPGLNGLLVVPDSHVREWRFSYVESEFGSKPVLEESLPAPGADLLPTAPGGIVAFNDKLLHGGAANRGRRTRVSMEVTLVLERPAGGAR